MKKTKINVHSSIIKKLSTEFERCNVSVKNALQYDHTKEKWDCDSETCQSIRKRVVVLENELVNKNQEFIKNQAIYFKPNRYD